MPAQEQKLDKEKTRPQIPALPPGTQLDLSLPKITAPDVPPFTLPGELSMAANEAAIESPAELLPEDWMIVARNSGLLYAYTMEDFDTEAYDANTLISPPKAVLPVLDWVVPARTNFMRPDFLDADVSSALTFTEETASYVRSGFDSESASGSYPGCAASFERDHKEREAKSSLEKNLHMIGRWHFPRATLDLRFCTAVSPNFVAAVRNAVTAGKPEALQEVFSNYGVAFPREVQLGGTQSFLHQQSVRGREWEKTVENTIKAAVSVKLGDLNANSGTAIQTGTSESTTAKSIAETSQFRVHGGDATEIGTPSAWASSVKKARLWQVIGASGLRSVLDLLDQDLRKKALDLWSRIPPVVSTPEDLPVATRSARAGSAGFLMATRDIGYEGPRGSVLLVCSKSKSGDPKLSEPGAVGGAASAHRWRDSDTWFDCGSVCLPVPMGYSFRTESADSERGGATRFAFAATKLEFGDWQAAFPAEPGVTSRSERSAASDGFLFVSVHVERHGDRSVVEGLVDDRHLGAASAHWWEPSDNHMRDASFCIPVPKESKYTVNPLHSVGAPAVKAWWLPIASKGWRLDGPAECSLNTELPAYTDGILNGFTSFDGDGERAFMRLYTGPDANLQGRRSKLSCASTAVHCYNKHDRWIKAGSVMLPVRQGEIYLAEFSPTSGTPIGTAYWTAIMPAD